MGVIQSVVIASDSTLGAVWMATDMQVMAANTVTTSCQLRARVQAFDRHAGRDEENHQAETDQHIAQWLKKRPRRLIGEIVGEVAGQSENGEDDWQSERGDNRQPDSG